jgi:hypothetical protein
MPTPVQACGVVKYGSAAEAAAAACDLHGQQVFPACSEAFVVSPMHQQPAQQAKTAADALGPVSWATAAGECRVLLRCMRGAGRRPGQGRGGGGGSGSGSRATCSARSSRPAFLRRCCAAPEACPACVPEMNPPAASCSLVPVIVPVATTRPSLTSTAVLDDSSSVYEQPPLGCEPNAIK